MRKRRTARDAGVPDDVEPPQIEANQPVINTADKDGKEKKDNDVVNTTNSTSKWERPVESFSWTILIVLTFAAFISRFYRIAKGNFVTYPNL